MDALIVSYTRCCWDTHAVHTLSFNYVEINCAFDLRKRAHTITVNVAVMLIVIEKQIQSPIGLS